MSTTAFVAELLEAVPANRLFGLRVEEASPAAGEVALDMRPELANVIGTLHASGLVALLDAAGLAAVLGQAPGPGGLAGVSALGAAAEVRFLAPAARALRCRCELDETAVVTVRAFFVGDVDRARVRTFAQTSDDEGAVVCDGWFDWRLRRA